MSLSSEEIERYARHIVLRGVGGPGQQKLKAARALLIGAGGLGSPAAQYLAAAGVGEIGIVDDDVVSLSNLQRQVLHGTGDIGRSKLDSAAEAIARLNPHVKVTPFAVRLTAENARDLARGFDVVVDGSDNFATRYAVSDACFYEKAPLVTAAVGSFDASLTTLRPFEAGVLGALTGIVGAMMTLEAMREIVGFGEGLVGRLVLFDALSMRFETLTYDWDPANPLNGARS